MSSRYGRNKKRRHRERIVELELTVARTVSDMYAAQLRLERSQRDLKDLVGAIEGVQPLSALLPAKVVSYDVGPHRECIRRPLGRDMLRLDRPPLDLPAPAFETFSLDMRIVQAHIERDRETLERLVHIRAGDHGLIYRMERHVSERIDLFPQAIKGVAAKVVEALVNDVVRMRRKP